MPQNLKFHEWRIVNSLGSVEAKFKLNDLLDSPFDGLVRAKVVYDTNGNLIDTQYFAYKMREFRNFKIVNIEFDYSKKFLDRSEIDAAGDKFEEIIMVKNGLVTDTSIANLAIFDNGWVTPKKPLLKGTTRTRLIENGFLQEDDISKVRLLNAKRFAIMNAMIDFLELKEFKFIS